MTLLTPDERDRNARWASVARRTHDLGATAHVQAAIENRPVPLDALHAAERALDALAEPDPFDDEPAWEPEP
jgi:hypothetical protein